MVTLAVAACAPAKEIVRRMPDGPGAEQVYVARFVRDYGRPPTYAERTTWRDGLDLRIDQYLARHPDIGTSPRTTLLRFDRRVAPEMTQEEVRLLLEAPDLRTTDRAAMAPAAAELWTQLAPQVKEMWEYPGGWCVYFDGPHVTAVTLRSTGPGP
jgi:hypothetical protein